MQTGSNQ
jgi:hypothetical protein